MTKSTGLFAKSPLGIVVLIIFLFIPSTLAKKPPLFELKTIDGTSYQLKNDLKKYVIILDFWATWCKPCLRELPHINDLYNEFKDQKLKVFAINVNDASSKSKVKPTIKRYKFNIPVLMDPSNTVLRKYSPNRNVPYLVIIGSEGKVVRDFVGYKPGDEKIIRNIVISELKKLQSVEKNIFDMSKKESPK